MLWLNVLSFSLNVTERWKFKYVAISETVVCDFCTFVNYFILRCWQRRTFSQKPYCICAAYNLTAVPDKLITQRKQLLTFVATASIAMPWRMGCQAPMSWAFSGTTRRNWVVIFQASTRISNRLLTRARTGARGKEATNRVTKPNWMTARDNIYILNTLALCLYHTQNKLQQISELNWINYSSRMSKLVNVLINYKL